MIERVVKLKLVYEEDFFGDVVLSRIVTEENELTVAQQTGLNENWEFSEKDIVADMARDAICFW